MTDQKVAPQVERTLSDLTRGHPKKPVDDSRAIERDQFLAGRGELADRFIASEFWNGLVLPAIEELYEDYLSSARQNSEKGLGGVHFAEDLVKLLAGYSYLGKRAVHRIAERTFGKDNVLPFKDEKRG